MQQPWPMIETVSPNEIQTSELRVARYLTLHYTPPCLSFFLNYVQKALIFFLNHRYRLVYLHNLRLISSFLWLVDLTRSMAKGHKSQVTALVTSVTVTGAGSINY